MKEQHVQENNDKKYFCLFIDEFTGLLDASDEAITSFLLAIRSARHDSNSLLQCVVATGTFSITRFTTLKHAQRMVHTKVNGKTCSSSPSTSPCTSPPSSIFTFSSAVRSPADCASLLSSSVSSSYVTPSKVSSSVISTSSPDVLASSTPSPRSRSPFNISQLVIASKLTRDQANNMFQHYVNDMAKRNFTIELGIIDKIYDSTQG